MVTSGGVALPFDSRPRGLRRRAAAAGTGLGGGTPAAPRLRLSHRGRGPLEHRDRVSHLAAEIVIVRAQAGDLLDQRLDAVDQPLAGAHHG